MTLLVMSLSAAYALRYGMFNPMALVRDNWALFGCAIVSGAVIFNALRLPRIKLHAMDSSAVLRLGSAAVLLSLVTMSASFILGISAPRSVPLIFGALFFLTSVMVRVGALHMLTTMARTASSRVPVAIYGAGAAGIQLASALSQSREVRPAFFVDDNPNLSGLLVNGLHVYTPDCLEKRIARHGIERVLVAIPSIRAVERAKIMKRLAKLSVEVMLLPSYVDIMETGGLERSLRPVTPDEVLGRDKVALDIPEVSKAYAGRTVLVTGAGGSIGSELCRQLLNCMPKKVVLFEQSEFALYTIDREMRALTAKMDNPVSIVTRLGSVTDRKRVQSLVREEGVEIILHAAAYKHVPLVEENELEGAHNNVIGTHVVADVAFEESVERFILVSTDKAVRPTNIMGATKRMAELVVQDFQTRSTQTKYAMVRFGNVLGSSGSVLPLFESQIRAGGPVTVTHEDVTRFFMTIPEASRLVLLAGAYAEGGDLFVLDMGKPQKIIDIARRMIQLSGRTVRDPKTGEGDIEIKVVGLRPGEKLYEELLIDDDSLVATPHPKIMRAEEMKLSQIEVAAMLREIDAAVETSDHKKLRALIEARVDGYHKPTLKKLRA
ncbi:polysaccharide biosynthesis protein [Celeribacter sp.]|uniref:polysaccharide biosynthesis protein n=1 Tax=Celeribacter sp. TaxID=1890673 RepID=UPI003A8D4ECA